MKSFRSSRSPYPGLAAAAQLHEPVRLLRAVGPGPGAQVGDGDRHVVRRLGEAGAFVVVGDGLYVEDH